MIGMKGKEDREETLGIIHNLFCFLLHFEKHVKNMLNDNNVSLKSDLRVSIMPMHHIHGIQGIQ